MDRIFEAIEEWTDNGIGRFRRKIFNQINTLKDIFQFVEQKILVFF